MELGISAFAEITPDGTSGRAVNAHTRMQQLLEEIKLADEVGLDVYALGEHHRPDFLISAPEVILAAAAGITKNIRLSSAVTVLSSADPVRVFQNFATVDLISSGRAEILAGRGSFIESFPLFGYDLDDYNSLFSEKLDLLLQINQHEKVTWKGRHRAPINDLGVYPRPLQASLPIWIGVGGTPASAARAGKLNLPMTLAILGGPPDRFVSFADIYRNAASEAGHDVSGLQLAINTHFYVSESSEQASDEFFPPYELLMNQVGRERGWSRMTRDQYEYSRTYGPLTVGSPEEITEKILRFHELFGNTRYLAQMVNSHELPHEKNLRAIELFGTKVAPAVRKALALSGATPANS